MSFGDLKNTTLDAFIKEEHARQAGNDRLWVFHHIPKTAGSSFSHDLAKMRPPYMNIHVDHAKTDVTVEDQLNIVTEEAIRRACAGELRSCSGHLRRQHIDRIEAEVPNTAFVTILRHPVDRVISSYRYQRTETHPGHEDFIRAFPTLEDFVRDRTSQNGISKFLWGMGRLPRPHEIARLLFERYSFVGTQESYDESVGIIARLMGAELPEVTSQVNITPDNARTTVSVDRALRREIASLNRSDMAIYRRVATLLKEARQGAV